MRCRSTTASGTAPSSPQRRGSRPQWVRSRTSRSRSISRPSAGRRSPIRRSRCRPAACSPTAIPITYVPARNTILLSLALAWAEVLDAQHIFFGANAVDYSGYPDCRPAFVQSFERLANLATKAAVEGRPLTVHTPIISLTKADIVRRGAALGVDYALTVSCYQADAEGRACGACDACRLRRARVRGGGSSRPDALLRRAADIERRYPGARGTCAGAAGVH